MLLSKLMKDVQAKPFSATKGGEIGGVCCDSRKVTPGCLFVAIRGFQSDGHRFIPMALERGATAILAEEPPQAALPEGVSWWICENARLGLAQVAANWFDHPERELKLVGVTGTNGKTTATHLLRHILQSCGEKCGLIGTNGVDNGAAFLPAERTTPESLELYGYLRQMVDHGCGYAVMEVSSHSLVLDRVAGLHFAAAAFTNLTQDHLDFHGDMEHYFAAKSQLFRHCTQAVVNLDDPWGTKLQQQLGCPCLSCSAQKDEAALVAKNVRLLPEGVQAVLICGNDIARLKLGIPGMFSVYNALTAIGCAMALGFSLERAAEALQTAEGVKGRAEIVPTGRDFTVMIDYSHTPDSMENILKTVRGYAKGRVIGLFGAGGDRDVTKRPLMGRIGEKGCDLCVVTSDNPRSEEPQAIIRDILAGMTNPQKYRVIPDRREAIAWCIQNAKRDDIIVLMGKGQETYQEIQGVKYPLDEREVVRQALAQLG